MGPEDFDYDLPPERIAQHPAPERADARLLVVGSGLLDVRVRHLPDVAAEVFSARPLFVANDSRVVPARLEATRRRDGRTFELLLCAPAPGQRVGTEVAAWVRGAKRLREGDVLRAPGLALRLLGRDAVDPRARRFRVEEGEVLTALERGGRVPLPPYIARPPDRRDEVRYQTIFARDPGSVAAPTAGLHFDENLRSTLDMVHVTLHVGPGTFLPIEAEDVREHKVGAERFRVSEEAASRIEAARAAGRPVVAVGTTVTRVLETVAGREDGRVVACEGTTDLVIVPGHRFRVIDALWTNFHLPRSSLLMLVCAFGGRERILAAYRHAVAAGYRFYSYGDAMLVLPQGAP
ncbi:MAG: tRNA preQ1(34) S-adenosylmethionine ribosyltransferase-isomerase QueA [Deltaproteobacteria bacterium]|nr:MAG: tRNA preQ1(34) S-adenosylmethionine ribosyltransferase-isomerase QueA [Deltaproteobacteria bacterium]